jgi:lysozyme family protein
VTGFERAMEFVLRWEGGYVNDPADPGGETNYGISKRAHPEMDIPSLTREMACEIYRAKYWDAIRGDELPYPLAMVTMDAAVLHGPANAVRFLQRALGVKDDGRIGKLTMAKIESLDFTNQVTHKAIQHRGWFIASIVQRDPTQARFLGGWIARLLDLASKV